MVLGPGGPGATVLQVAAVIFVGSQTQISEGKFTMSREIEPVRRSRSRVYGSGTFGAFWAFRPTFIEMCIG